MLLRSIYIYWGMLILKKHPARMLNNTGEISGQNDVSLHCHPPPPATRYKKYKVLMPTNKAIDEF